MGFLGTIISPLGTLAPKLDPITLIGKKVGGVGGAIIDPASNFRDPPPPETFESPPPETSTALLAPEELPAHRKSSLLTG